MVTSTMYWLLTFTERTMIEGLPCYTEEGSRFAKIKSQNKIKQRAQSEKTKGRFMKKKKGRRIDGSGTCLHPHCHLMQIT